MTIQRHRISNERFLELTIFPLSLIAICSIAYAAMAAERRKEESGFESLTGHKGCDQWLGYGLDQAKNTWPENWEFVDGVLHAKLAGEDLKTKHQYGDFDLRFEWKVSRGANS